MYRPCTQHLEYLQNAIGETRQTPLTPSVLPGDEIIGMSLKYGSTEVQDVIHLCIHLQTSFLPPAQLLQRDFFPLTASPCHNSIHILTPGLFAPPPS